MTDDRFEELMRDAAHTYRKPPEADLDAMWQHIEAAHFDAAPTESITGATQPRKFSIPRWIGIAATLVIGVGIGRASISLGAASTATKPDAAVATVASNANGSGNSDANASAVRADSIAGAPYEAETSKYLGQTAALLIALPSEARSGRADEQFVTRANELLGRTRLLIDSPAANDPQMRTLFEDLELVLAQVVRLQNNHSRTELDIINRALEQRDVIPRLRTAAADISAN